MATAEIDVSAIKGRRISGKPGRFDPSEPFHMSTRRANKHSGTNGSPSANGSMDEDDSIQDMFDDLRPVASQSNGSPPSPQALALEDQSGPLATAEYAIDPLLSYDHEQEQQQQQQQQQQLQSQQQQHPELELEILQPSSPMRPSPSPSRKRKRSSSQPQPGADTIESVDFTDRIYPLVYDDDRDNDDEGDTAEVIDEDMLSDREDSSQSDEAEPADVIDPGLSIDATPHISEPQSPATSDSIDDEHAPLAKPLNEALQEVVRTAQRDETDGIDEADDAEDGDADVDVDVDVDADGDADADDADEVDDGEEQTRWDDEGRPRRRPGGRRRAAHPNPLVEAHMRRQAKLKSAYRSIARAQKAILAEIASRTVEDLEANATRHTEAVEYNQVRTELDEVLEKRQRQLQTRHDLNVQQLLQRYEGEKKVALDIHRQNFDEFKDQQLNRLDREMVRIVRAAQMEAEDADHETEDEDGVIPELKRMGYGWKRATALDEVYDSRSRRLLETDLAADDLARRLSMQELIYEFHARAEDGDSLARPPRKFTVMDSAPRNYALARRQNIDDTNTLALAAEEVERLSRIPVIRNEDAIGLQLLGDLATRPSIVSSTRKAMKRKGRKSSTNEAAPPLPLPPPPLLPPIPAEPNPMIPIQFALSPRTAHLIGDRLANPMPPPPSTPQQSHVSYMRPGELPRPELHAPPPLKHEHRVNGLEPILGFPDNRPPSQHSGYYYDNVPRPFHPYSEPRPDPARMDFRPGLWREYPPMETMRSASAIGPSSSPFANVMIVRDERSDPVAIDPALDTEPPPDNLVRVGQWPDRARETSSMEILRPGERRPSMSESSRRTSYDRPRSPHSRPSSASISARESKLDPGLAGETSTRQKSKGSRGGLHRKAPKGDKADKGRAPRSQWSQSQWKLNKNNDERGPPLQSPTIPPATFSGSPRDQHSQLPAWPAHPPPHHSPPYSVPPPPTSQFHGSPYGPPPPQPHQYPPARSEQEAHAYRYHYRDYNYPPQPLPPPPPAPPSWNHPPPSPRYAGAHLESPSYVTEHYSRLPNPPPPHHPRGPPIAAPPPSYQASSPVSAPPPQPAPPAPAQTSQSSTNASSSLSDHYSQQRYSGPPIAPATPTSVFPSSTGGTQSAGRLPAFAQRGQGASTYRRRTASDGFQVHKFHNYNPPGQKGKG